MPFRYHHPWMGMGAGRGPLGLLFVLAVVALVVWAIVTLTRKWGTHARPAVASPAGPPATTAQQILDERFARGEIDAEEFTRRRALLRSAP